MQCPRCGFENIPGITTCFQCGSVMEGKAPPPGEVHPPRAKKWTLPLRRFRRRIKRNAFFRAFDGLSARIADNLADRLEPYGLVRRDGGRRALIFNLLNLLLSIVPGLAQVFDGKIRRVWHYQLTWLVCMGLGIFLYRSTWGTILLSTAVTLHAWLMMEAVMPSEEIKITTFRQFGGRLATLAVFIMAAWGLFALARWPVLRNYNFGQAAIDTPFHRVETGDMILCRRLRGDLSSLRRGDLVLVRTVYGAGYYHAPVTAVTQIIGLPGDTVSVNEGEIRINGEALDMSAFAEPNWINNIPLYANLDNQIFVVFNFQNLPHAPAIEQNIGIIRHYSILNTNNILGRGIMRWAPVRRRGYLKEVE